jgi:hypothetical protein
MKATEMGINTASPSAMLHVKGSGATSATTSLRVENNNASPSLVVLDNGYVGIGTGSASYKLEVVDGGSTYVAQFRGSNSSYVVSGDTSLAGESGFNSRNSSGQMFLNVSASIVSLTATSGANTLVFNILGTERMRVNNSGNVGIGTSTPAYKLDVSGSVRFNVGATNPIIFGRNITYPNVPSISMNNTLSDTLMAGFFADDLNFYINSPNRIIIRGSGNANNSSFVFSNGSMGQGYGSYNTNPSSTDGIYAAGKIGVGTNTPVASAKMQIDSTTQGFLPPRMTNAQRTAISTPAVGLMVYCTDATEGLYIYKSTGWTFIV